MFLRLVWFTLEEENEPIRLLVPWFDMRVTWIFVRLTKLKIRYIRDLKNIQDNSNAVELNKSTTASFFHDNHEKLVIIKKHRVWFSNPGIHLQIKVWQQICSSEFLLGFNVNIYLTLELKRHSWQTTMSTSTLSDWESDVSDFENSH